MTLTSFTEVLSLIKNRFRCPKYCSTHRWGTSDIAVITTSSFFTSGFYEQIILMNSLSRNFVRLMITTPLPLSCLSMIMLLLCERFYLQDNDFIDRIRIRQDKTRQKFYWQDKGRGVVRQNSNCKFLSKCLHNSKKKTNSWLN